MKNYLVIIKVQDPFEKKWEVTATATTAQAALRRAVEKWRKEHWARRPLNEFSAYVKKI